MKGKQKELSRRSSSPLPSQLSFRVREGFFILALAISTFFILGLITYTPVDPGWTHTSSQGQIMNAGGPAGAWFADVLLSLFGLLAFGFPLMLGVGAWILFKHRHDDTAIIQYEMIALRIIGFAMALMAGCTLSSIYFDVGFLDYPIGPGGILGKIVSQLLLSNLHMTGASLLLLSIFLVGVTFATGLSWLKLMDWMGRLLFKILGMAGSEVNHSFIHLKSWHLRRKQYELSKPVILKQAVDLKTLRASAPAASKSTSGMGSGFGSEIKLVKKKNAIANQAPLFKDGIEGGMPSLTLLEVPQHREEAVYSQHSLDSMSRQVEEKLKDFGVEVNVVAVHPGPVVTRFELELAAGIKASKITGLARDLARSLAVTSVRVVEIIPGKPYVGLELPNAHRQMVYLSELIASEEYEKSQSPISLVLGKDIAGNPVVVDLAKMPHLLVAGTTGAGKSVGLNVFLLSMLYKSTPEDVRFIMIDPKMLELSVYADIPHLLTPVVTDMKEAANALKWCVAEMERRYKLMSALGVRNLAGYNHKVQEAIKSKQPLKDPLFIPKHDDEHASELGQLSHIVVIIDEFADMIMVVGKKVEELIARIAQKARAAGIHLILATQRPSVDVITGLIKANVPSRIAFQVASRIDSRTILDQQGAEQLLGRGDMLYLPVGAGIATRVHGAFVSDTEVHAVVSDWKKRGRPEYIEDIVSTASFGASEGDYEDEDAESDPLYDEAVQIVIESRRASISMVQRRLKVGYNRAARLIEQMEAAGLVSAMQSNGAREVLVPGQ